MPHHLFRVHGQHQHICPHDRASSVQNGTKCTCVCAEWHEECGCVCRSRVPWCCNGDLHILVAAVLHSACLPRLLQGAQQMLCAMQHAECCQAAPESLVHAAKHTIICTPLFGDSRKVNLHGQDGQKRVWWTGGPSSSLLFQVGLAQTGMQFV